MPIYTKIGLTSTGNTTTTPLGVSATFTGTAEQNDFATVGVQVRTDQDCTLHFEFSNDGVNWDDTTSFNVKPNVTQLHTAVKLGRYFRIRIVNGSTLQTFLRATTYYSNDFVPTVTPLNKASAIDDDAIQVRSTVPNDDVRIGRIAGAKGVTKWGFNLDIDSAAQEVIAPQGGSYTPPLTSDTYTITYNPSTDGAGGGATGATQLAISYIDVDGVEQTALVALGSSGSDVTAFSGFGINRVACSATGSANVNVNDITVAQTSGNTEAFVPAGYGVTQQCIFHNGSNHDAVLKYLILNVRKLAGGGGDPRVTVHGYVLNRQFQSRFDIFDYNIDTNVENSVSIHEPVGFLLSPSDTLWFEAETDTNNTAVNMRFSGVEYQRS